MLNMIKNDRYGVKKMKIQVKMVSGTTYKVENDKHNTVEDWVSDNLFAKNDSVNILFYKFNKDSDFIININNIEEIREI